ncbi:uncharacterized protein J3D65DRAFT_315104 [Phyllosticta citribraziliensis]|uniref:Uncharacterized protein n=1 Tax=Phyllosticta citribraziliensis TaxID=989973 RepID=A0ABR1LWE3_9PEZI
MPVEIVRYTKEQLLHLKDSPLVHKPDGLPSIEQWMDVPQEQQTTQRKGRTQSGRGDDQTASQENGAQRSLFPGKHLTRHSSTAPEDIVLGPPKTAFASSSRVAKLSDLSEKDDEATAERVNIRDKFFKERESERSKNGTVNGRRANREEGEGWTNVRGRRTSFAEDGVERPPRMGRFTRDAADGEETTPRRKKFEQPWGRDSAEKEGETSHKSWRDRRDDRWTRGNERVEEDPEWIDAAPKRKDDVGMGRFARTKGPEWLNDDPKDDKKVHTQEDFQRWKERMKAGAAVAEDKENTPEPPSAKDTPVSSKPITPMVIEGKDMFGMWGAAAVKQSEAPSTTEGAPVPKNKPPQKSSKFAKLFTPQEEQMPPQPPPVEQQQPPPMSQAPPTRHHMLRSREEKAGFIESVLSRGTPTDFKGPQGAFGPFSPATDPGQEQPVRPESIRSGEERLGPATPNSNGMHQFGMMGTQAPPPPAQLSRDREFLLNLMTGPQRSTPPQPTQARPPPPPDMFAGAFMDKKVPPFMENPVMGPPQPPRGNPPPGLFEERQFPENDVRYQPQPPRRMPENPEIENAMRRASRFNLPIHLDDPAIAHIQRRNTADGGMPRNQPHNMGIPQQPPPDQLWTMKPPGLQQPQERPPASMAPPPGFPAPNANPQIRGPPGFVPGPANMGLPPPFSAGNTPLGHPGMQVQRGPGPAAMFPGQGPPPGYFAPPPPGPPPGFGPGPGPMGLGMGGPQGQDMMGMRAGGPPPGMARPPNGFDMFDRSLGRGQGKGGSYRL